MDTALKLRLAFEKQQNLSEAEIEDLLAHSQLVEKLTKDALDAPFDVLFRLIGLSEIPYAERLPYTEKLMEQARNFFVTEAGFSYTGRLEDIVPCYNALLVEAFTRLGEGETPEVRAGIDWIKKYQLFQRNQVSPWPHQGICKFGGCLKKTPCYIGVGKSVRALLTYETWPGIEKSEVHREITAGVSYLSKHAFYRRLTNGEPISAHITDLMFPQNYALALTDLIYIVGRGQLAGEPQSQQVLQLLKEKELATGGWKIDYIYQQKGYRAFDGRRKASPWLSHLLPLWLAQTE